MTMDALADSDHPARVLFWSHSFLPSIGGGEVWALRLLGSLASRGLDVCALSVDGAKAGRESFGSIDLFRFPLQEVISSGQSREFQRLRDQASNVVAAFHPHCLVLSGFGLSSLMLFWLTKAAHRVPLVVFVHNEWPDVSVGPGSLADRTARAAHAICVVDPSLKAWVHKRWPDLADRVRVIPQALPRPTRPIRPPPALPRIVFCGRLSHEKGPDVAIRAFADLLLRCPEAELTIAGDGVLRREAEQWAARIGIQKAVHFLGWVAPDDVSDLLDANSFVVMPSRLEGFGLVALEAALRGRAVIASSVGGLRGLVQHGKTGFLCPVDDVRSFATAMECLCRDPARARLMGEAAAASAAQRPDWDSHVDLTLQVLREACASYGTTPALPNGLRPS